MTCAKSDPSSLSLASECMRSGGIAVFPTDTVYGFSGIVDLRGGTSFSTDARIRSVKGRAETKPLIQLISHPEEIFCYTDIDIPEKLLNLWPGALTLIVPLKDACPILSDVPTVAFRCPGDEWLRKVIEHSGAPIYSTSVNKSGKKVLECEAEIEKVFGESVDLFISDGDKTGALPSTLVKIEADGSFTVLRQGSVRL